MCRGRDPAGIRPRHGRALQYSPFTPVDISRSPVVRKIVDLPACCPVIPLVIDYIPVAGLRTPCACCPIRPGVCAMRNLPTPSRARGRIWAGCLLLAVATVGAVAAGPAPRRAGVAGLAAGAPRRSSRHQGRRGRRPGQVTWSVVPATSTGPDPNRLEFSYGVVKAGSTIKDHVEIVNRSAQSAAFSIYATDATGTSRVGCAAAAGAPARNRPISAPGPASRAAPASCRRLSPAIRRSSSRSRSTCPRRPRRATTPAPWSRRSACTKQERRGRERHRELPDRGAA